eukprot:6565167-Pyramimonas_sp.AAC.1
MAGALVLDADAVGEEEVVLGGGGAVLHVHTPHLHTHPLRTRARSNQTTFNIHTRPLQSDNIQHTHTPAPIRQHSTCNIQHTTYSIHTSYPRHAPGGKACVRLYIYI